VIARCTAENPSDRYQSVDEILYDINHRRRYFRYVAAFVAIGAVLAIGIALLTHQENVAPEVKEVQKDSVVIVAQRDSLEEDKSLDSVIQNDPVQLPQSPKKDTETLFREDMIRMIDKAYRSTIVNFCDSIFPPRVNYPGNPWQDAATEFHNQAIEIGDRLVEKYPTIPESVIRQETEMRFEGLVTYVFNKMRTNDPQ
jgi:hypothetical protein